jgi:hypothetical protein
MLLKRCDYSTCCPGKIAHTPQVKECWLAPRIQAHKGKENNTLQNAQKAKSTQESEADVSSSRFSGFESMQRLNLGAKPLDHPRGPHP